MRPATGRPSAAAGDRSFPAGVIALMERYAG